MARSLHYFNADSNNRSPLARGDTMRTKFDSTCHYCGKDVKAGNGDCWKYKGRWYVAGDCCKSHPKQVAARKKHAKRKAAKKAEQAQAPATDLKKQLESLSKADLVRLLTSISK